MKIEYFQGKFGVGKQPVIYSHECWVKLDNLEVLLLKSFSTF